MRSNFLLKQSSQLHYDNDPFSSSSNQSENTRNNQSEESRRRHANYTELSLSLSINQYVLIKH